MVNKVLKSESFDLRSNFNDVCMREMHLDIDDYNHVVDVDTESILQIKEKFIYYPEYEYTIIPSNDIELNLLENSRLMETLFTLYLSKYFKRKNMQITVEAISQDMIPGSEKGVTTISYLDTDHIVKQIISDKYVNESVRMLSLICNFNKTSHLYDLDNFDVVIEKG